jgi:transcriptional regulator with XRE-family HTH domain
MNVDVSETFRLNLLKVLKERKVSAASVSRKAGLNIRAVKDIEERRAKSPRIVTVFKLAEALEIPPQDLLGLDKCHCASASDLNDAVKFFSSLPIEQRELLLSTIVQLVAASKEGAVTKL